MTTPKPKLLFLLSNDYGEWAGAIHFIAGCSFEPVLVAPARIFQANLEGQAFRMLPYESVDDVLTIIDRETPEIVFLFSGYLFAINLIFNLEDFSSLVQQMQQRGCRLVTTDPFLGIMSDIGPGTFSDRHPLGKAFADHFVRTFEIVKNMIHLYPVDPRGLVRAPSACAFNPKMILPPGVLEESNRQVTHALRLNPEKRRWAFVLSTEDYVGQASRQGSKEFAAALLLKLRESASQGKQPVLIAPDSCLAAIQNAAETIPDLLLLPFLDHGVFRALLLEVEYVFYWNILSNSILNRVINRLPVFFFDRGHLAHAVLPMYERAHQRYYGEEELPFLTQQAPLEKSHLLHLARQQESLLSTIVNRFLQLPTPEEIVAVILQDQGVSA